MNAKTETYKSNTDPKIGDVIRFSRDIKENKDELFRVETVGGGRLGNKVGVLLTHVNGEIFKGSQHCREYYYYCLCPQ